MADDVTSVGPRGEPPPEGLSLLARLRGHLIDLTPLRRSRDFRLLFAGLAVSHFGTEITFVVHHRASVAREGYVQPRHRIQRRLLPLPGRTAARRSSRSGSPPRTASA